MMAASSRLARLTIIPAAVFALLAGVLLIGLQSDDPSIVPSALVGKPAPHFDLPPLQGSGVPGLSSADLTAGRVTVIWPLAPVR